MKIKKINKDGTAILKLDGDLNFTTHRNLQQAVEELMNKKQKAIVIDLGKVSHIDSMGIGTLAQLWKEGYEHGLEVSLAAPNPSVANMIRLVNLDKRIKIYDSIEDSLK